MAEALKEFFGFGGYEREAEGFLSWQHLVFVSSLMLLMTALAIALGRRNRNRPEREKNRVLIVAAILIDAFEIFKVIIMGLRGNNLLFALPLFICSVQLFSLPLAAFAKDRVREASLDFIFIFGVLCAVLGTYGAGQNYGAYPVLSFDNVISGITHSISGFASLYIAIAGMMSMKRSNIWITFGILIAFSAAAYVADVLIPYNYMFLMRGDGTPYDIFYNLVGGHRVFYPLTVIGLFIAYIVLFYLVYYPIRKKNASRA